jgi:hypothetical protein
VHETCRSCHVPPERPDPKAPLNDCANCHLPERSPASLYSILPDRTVTPVVTFEAGVPEALREAFVAGLREDLDGSALQVVPRSDPKALVVTIHVSIVAEPGRTDAGTPFFAARARAAVRLIRNELAVEGGHAAARTREEALTKAMLRLREKVNLTLTW